MSQHICETKTESGQPVTVTMGYDRPLDYVFCTVMDGEGEALYSNLDREDGTEVQDVNEYREPLKELGIDVPEQMFHQVAKDQLRGVGNRVVTYSVEPGGPE